MLTVLRESGQYEPMTDAEFEEFRKVNPDVAKYFELNDDETETAPISELEVPEVSSQAPIFDHWEKAAQRCLLNLQRNPKSQLFAEPVDAEVLKIPDYYHIVKTPMDFSTVKLKLKEHKYTKIGEFVADMDLVFQNCKQYNGVDSEVGQIGVNIQEEFHRHAEALCFDFYTRQV